MTRVAVSCPTCGMHLKLDPADMRLCSAPEQLDETVRFDCPDCGMQTRQVSLLLAAKMLDRGMPSPISDEDVVAFQMVVAFDPRAPYLASIAEAEVKGVSR